MSRGRAPQQAGLPSEDTAPRPPTVVVLSAALVGIMTWSALDAANVGSSAAARPPLDLTIPVPAADTSSDERTSSHAAAHESIGALPKTVRPRSASLVRLSVSDVHVRGRTARPLRSLRAAFKRSTQRVLPCLQRTPAALLSADTLMLSLRVGSDGTVIWARPNGDSRGLGPAVPCIAQALRATVFPSSYAGLHVDAVLQFSAP